MTRLVRKAALLVATWEGEMNYSALHNELQCHLQAQMAIHKFK